MNEFNIDKTIIYSDGVILESVDESNGEDYSVHVHLKMNSDGSVTLLDCEYLKPDTTDSL